MKQVRPAVVLGVLLMAYLASQVTHGLFFVVTPLWLLGPGYLIERWLGSSLRRRAPMTRLTLWLGLSLAVLPLMYLWTTTVGLSIRPPAIVAATLLVAAGCLYFGWQDLAVIELRAESTTWVMPLLMVLVVVLTGWKRAHEIEGLVFPPWVDAVHHALMIRVAWETGRAPLSLVPYLPIDHLAYHWGYHVIAATLLQLTDLSLPLMMLWFGQVLATAAVVTTGGLAYALTRRPLAAVVAGGVTGLVALIPAYFLSWGRYTLLAGLLLLPVVLIATVEVLQDGSRQAVVLLALLLAGISLIHFVAFCLALLWCGSAWLMHPVGSQRKGRSFALLLGAGLLALAATAPWINVLIHQALAATTATSPLRIEGGGYNGMPPDLLWLPGNRGLVVGALLCSGLGLYRRSQAVVTILVWAALVTVCANPVWFGLPYLSFFNNRIVVLALFLPASLLLAVGAACADDMVRGVLQRRVNQAQGSMPPKLMPAVARRAPKRLLPAWNACVALLTAAWLGWSAAVLLPRDLVLNQALVFAGPADLQALTWVIGHLPADARFAINTEAWLYAVNRGSDGGWWLLPFAGRQVSTPPVIYVYGDARYTRAVTLQTSELRDAAGKGADELAALMDRWQLDYAYATKGGRIFDPATLRGSSRFDEVYQSATISIFHRKS